MPGALLLAVACGGGSSSPSSPWVIQEVPGGTLGATYSIWAFADDDVWLGGSSVWNHDGAVWTEVPLPVANTFIVDFWGFAPDDLWAIGGESVWRWDGGAWAELAPAEGLPFEALTVIWGASPTDVWIANSDNSKVYHHDGTGWTRQTLQFVQAHALWGSASDDIWLTGPFDTYHFDGAGWTVYEPPSFGPEPRGAYAMWGAAPDDVWASSSFGFVHWNGSVWTEIEADDDYNSMWGFGPGDIYAVGSRGTMAHWNGSRWTETTGHLSLQQNFTRVHGSSPDNLWATGVDFDTLTGIVLRLER
jgi:hypothetical protein